MNLTLNSGISQLGQSVCLKRKYRFRKLTMNFGSPWNMNGWRKCQTNDSDDMENNISTQRMDHTKC